MTRKFFTKAKQIVGEIKLARHKKIPTDNAEIISFSLRLTKAEYEQVTLYIKTMYPEPNPSITAVIKHLVVSNTRLK